VGVLTAASELGIDIAPLLAGVGIAGLAIGFGAQTLVKDVITGLFILMEDQVAVGEYVSVAGHSGIVEGLSIRTIRLRDLSGTVHVVPFGEVGTVENLTRDYSYAVIDAGVGYSEDTDRVSDVLREVAASMESDEDWRDRIIPPFEVFGVQELGDSAVVVRCRFKTPPMQQWAVAREFRRRMKKRFDELGIEIPFPHRTVYFGGGKPPDSIAES
ncbi:MAG: mechanosensitive ion channel family protein, partial [Alphaproteobacteria bacterium]|nr:mechanosensitive ion channel family protein [Alphaproteobacteria bacterium]